jgi:hypothetical protein
MQVTVQVSNAAALPLRELAPETPASRAVVRLVTELGLDLRAMHPTSDDPILRTYFVADVPAGHVGASIVERLRRDPSIAAAYLRPPEAAAS